MVPRPKLGGGLLEKFQVVIQNKNIKLKNYDKEILGRLAEKIW